MNYIATAPASLLDSLQTVWAGLGPALVAVVLAVVIIVIGALIGWLAKHAIEELFKAIHIDKALAHTGLEEALDRAGYKLNSGRFVGEIIRWFFIIVFAIFAFDYLQFDSFNEFLSTIALFLPQLVVAALIIFAGALIAEALAKVTKATLKASAHGKASHMVGSVVRWIVWIVVILTALEQIGIPTLYLQTFYQAIAWALAGGIGLAFGLGGKDLAQRILEHVRHNVKEDQHHDDK
jgi:small-conductance mechanosensitive channel